MYKHYKHCRSLANVFEFVKQFANIILLLDEETNKWKQKKMKMNAIKTFRKKYKHFK